MAARIARITKELIMLANDPGPGISAWPVDESDMMHLQAQIQGPQESPYQGGLYNLTVDIPDRYPFEPPRVRFITPIYHPNIDSDGRICLDTLKMQPHGSWSPSVNINTLLLTIRVLMSNPNADDGLVPDITEEYKRDVTLWMRKAVEHTKLNALPGDLVLSQGNILSTSNVDQVKVNTERGAAVPELAPADGSSDDDDEESEDGSDNDDTSVRICGSKRVQRDDACQADSREVPKVARIETL